MTGEKSIQILSFAPGRGKDPGTKAWRRWAVSEIAQILAIQIPLKLRRTKRRALET
jgi:hypothetical protein